MQNVICIRVSCKKYEYKLNVFTIITVSYVTDAMYYENLQPRNWSRFTCFPHKAKGFQSLPPINGSPDIVDYLLI